MTYKPRKQFKNLRRLMGLSSLILFCSCHPAFAYNYFGRVITGGYFSAESFNDTSNGMPTNDFSSVSNRFYLKATDIGSAQLESTVDFRDKDDFFDKLDQENLTLTPVNKFQAYQLNIHLPNERVGYYATVGRFSLAENGGEFTDGAQVGYRWNSSWQSYGFGGFNPRTPDQTYVGFNSNAQNFGFGSIYQPRSSSWLSNTYWSNALVSEEVQGHMDRLYLYNNLIYSWHEPDQIIALVYLDFVPDVYIQTALVSYHQTLPDHWSTTANISAIDVLQYQRSQGLLEQLPSSPYKEGSVNFRREMGSSTFLDTNLIYGYRTADSLHKIEASVGPSAYRLWDDHLNGKFLLGGRKNFTSVDGFSQLGGGYFSKNWEYDLSITYTLSTQNDAGAIYHQWLNEFSISRYFSHDFFGTVELQQGQDERLTIWGGFLKLSYLFGERNTSPIRNTAPIPLPPPPAGRIN